MAKKKKRDCMEAAIKVDQGSLDKKSLKSLTNSIIDILMVEESGDTAKIAGLQVLEKTMRAAPVSISGCSIEIK